MQNIDLCPYRIGINELDYYFPFFIENLYNLYAVEAVYRW